MTPEQLDAIQARADAATEGPWDRPLNTRYRASVTANMPKGDPSSRWRDQVDHKGNPERVSIVSCPIWSDGKFMRKQSGRDLEFIAAARTDVPALLAYARDLEARNDKARELHRPITHHFLTLPAGSLEVCEACRWEYPCPTVAALTATKGQA